MLTITRQKLCITKDPNGNRIVETLEELKSKTEMKILLVGF